MKFHSIIIPVLFVVLIVDNNLAIDTKPELKNNVLNFRYRANFKYKGMLSYSFDRFYVVTKFEMPKDKDLKLTTFTFDLPCEHLNNPKSYIHCYLTLSVSHATIVSLCHLVEKVPLQELFSAQRLA